MSTDLPTIADLTSDWIRRVITYSAELRYFGTNSAGQALAVATAQQTAGSEALCRALFRRDTLIGAVGDALTEVAEESGVPRLGPTRSQVLVIVQPWPATVTAITASTLIELDDASHFDAADSIRIVSGDGATTEILTVLAKTSGTGPNGGDELSVGPIVGLYDPTADVVKVLLRETLEAGTTFVSDAGINFQSLDDLTIGDANPVLAGESTALALADKVWCEAVTAGAAGQIEQLSISRLQTPNAKIRAVFNPGRAQGGVDDEADFDLKYRTAHQPQLGAIETNAFLETLARAGDVTVLRAFPEDSDAISTLRIRVLTRSGGGLSSDARAALARFMGARVRSSFAVEVRNVVITAVEVEADVTLDPTTDTPAERLRKVGVKAADRLAVYVDWRKWPEAQEVDSGELLSLVRGTPGIASLATSSFTPADAIVVPAASVPVLTRLVLRDTVSGLTFGVDLATSY